MKVLEAMLYARLNGDTTLRNLAPGGVWRGVAPEDATGTVVVFSLQAATDTYALASRAYSDATYQVKAITPGESAAPAWAAAERAEALLTDQPLTVSGGRVMACRRTTVISLTETDGGEQYQHAGGLYRITIQE